MARLVEQYRLKAAILQMEDQPHRNRDDLIAFRLRGDLTKTTADRREAFDWVKRSFVTIKPPEDYRRDNRRDLNWLIGTIEEAVRVHDCKLVVIDPWNEVEHVFGVNESETRYTNDALMRLKEISRSLNVGVIIVAHPGKEGGRGTDITKLDLYDVSGSSAWYNKSDYGVNVMRHPLAKFVSYVKISKTKNHRLMGTPGILEMMWHADRADYQCLGRYDPDV